MIEPGRPWNGFDTWQCKLCPYNDTDYERTLYHLKQHGVGLEEERTKTSLIGLDGKPLFMEVLRE